MQFRTDIQETSHARVWTTFILRYIPQVEIILSGGHVRTDPAPFMG